MTLPFSVIQQYGVGVASGWSCTLLLMSMSYIMYLPCDGWRWLRWRYSIFIWPTSLVLKNKWQATASTYTYVHVWLACKAANPPSTSIKIEQDTGSGGSLLLSSLELELWMWRHLLRKKRRRRHRSHGPLPLSLSSPMAMTVLLVATAVLCYRRDAMAGICWDTITYLSSRHGSWVMAWLSMAAGMAWYYLLR